MAQVQVEPLATIEFAAVEGRPAGGINAWPRHFAG
jgi:hypothetical protein